MDDLSVVIARLEKVEKENRRMKRAGLLCLLAAGCVLVMGQARPAARAVEAQSFVLQDASGAKRAELVLEAGAPGSQPSPVLICRCQGRRHVVDVFDSIGIGGEVGLGAGYSFGR